MAVCHASRRTWTTFTTSPKRPKKNNDAFATWTCDVREHAIRAGGSRPHAALGLARRPYRGKRVVRNAHDVYDRMILLYASEEDGTQLRRRPRSKRVWRNRQVIDQSGLKFFLLLPQQVATPEGAQVTGGRPRRRPRTGQPHAPRVRPNMTQWSDGTNHLGRTPLGPVRRGRPAVGSELRVASSGTCICPTVFSSQKKIQENRQEKREFSARRPTEQHKFETFGNRQSQSARKHSATLSCLTSLPGSACCRAS